MKMVFVNKIKIHRKLLLAVIIGTCVFTESLWAAPVVASYSPVASVRTGRTTFDYTYRPLVRGDGDSYHDAAFKVTSSASTTQIIDNSVNIGDLDAGIVLLAKDTFTIRQDRLVPFDPNALHFEFSGEATSISTGQSNRSVGKILFLESGGRPGHEGTFPIQATEPSAGKKLPVRVEIFGKVASANYRILDLKGQLLEESPLTSYPASIISSPYYVAFVNIPTPILL